MNQDPKFQQLYHDMFSTVKESSKSSKKKRDLEPEKSKPTKKEGARKSPRRKQQRTVRSTDFGQVISECAVCGLEEHDEEKENDMIVCDQCEREFHFQCLTPPIKSLDDLGERKNDEWFCDKCRASQDTSDILQPRKKMSQRPQEVVSNSLLLLEQMSAANNDKTTTSSSVQPNRTESNEDPVTVEDQQIDPLPIKEFDPLEKFANDTASKLFELSPEEIEQYLANAKKKALALQQEAKEKKRKILRDQLIAIVSKSSFGVGDVCCADCGISLNLLKAFRESSRFVSDSGSHYCFQCAGFHLQSK